MKKLITILFLVNIIILTFTVKADANDMGYMGYIGKTNRSCFIQNKGQWDKSVLYLAKSNGMNAWITKNGVVYDYYKINRVNDSVSTLKTT